MLKILGGQQTRAAFPVRRSLGQSGDQHPVLPLFFIPEDKGIAPVCQLIYFTVRAKSIFRNRLPCAQVLADSMTGELFPSGKIQ